MTTTPDNRHSRSEVGPHSPFHAARFYVAATVALIFGHFLAVDSRELARACWPALDGYWTLIALFALLAGALLWIHHDRLQKRGVVIATAFTVLIAQWLALGLHAALGHHSPPPVPTPWWHILAWLLLSVFSAWEAHHLRSAVESVRTLSDPITTSEYIRAHGPLVGLVLFVSPPTRVPEIQTEAGRTTMIRLRGRNGGRTLTLPLSSASDAIDKLPELDGQHNWEQMLRAIAPLAASVRQIWLVGSTGNSTPPKPPHEEADGPAGSAIYLESHARPFLQPFAPNAKIAALAAVDFQDFDALTKRLHTCLLQAKAAGIPPHRLVVDITSGIKLSSIAGAMLTVNRRALVQYVPTRSAPTGAEAAQEPRVYDLRRDSLSGPEGG